jgi:hypothetical protein
MEESDTELIDAARDEVTKAINNYIEVNSKVLNHENPFVLGYACYIEYTSTTHINDGNATGNVAVVPDGQGTATTRGLFEFGADSYTWVRQAIPSERSE